MAIISKIRNRAGLAIGIVGFSLVAFILGDLLTSNKSFLRGSGTTVAVIGGHKINVQDFEQMVNENIEKYKMGQNKETIDQQTQDQLRDQSWGQLLNEELIYKQVEKTGLVVTSDEIYDMVQGKNIHPQIKQAFTDPQTGQFKPEKVIEFLKNMDNDPSGKSKAQWLNFENGVKEERYSQKYYNMIKGGMYVTSEEAKRDYFDKSRTASIKYVELNYNTIGDSTVKYDESDLKTYYNAHSDKYKQEAARKIEYVTFDVIPSNEDRQSVLDAVGKLKDEFAAGTNDSLFIAANSDVKWDDTYHKKGTLSPYIDSIMFHSPIGATFGPYEENDSWSIAKLIDTKSISDSIKLSHALIAYKGAERADPGIARTQAEAKVIADSLFKIAKGGEASFIDIAKNKSDDKVSAMKDGDLGWLTKQSSMDPKFLAGAFDTKKGDVSLVESPFGFHIIRVFDQNAASPQVKVAILGRKVEASNKTYQAIYAKANEFAGKNNSGDLFTKAAKEQNLNPKLVERLSEAERNVPGLENARELVRWAYKANKDEVSKSMDINDKFVIAHLIEIYEKGIAPMEQVKDQVIAEVRKEKKAQMLVDKLGTALSSSGGNLETLASKVGQPVKTAETVAFGSPYLPGLGMEQEMVGSVFTLKPASLSKPIKGEQGVFVVSVEKFNEPAPTKDYTTNRKQIMTQFQSRSQYEVFNALKEKADIEDNRGKFY